MVVCISRGCTAVGGHCCANLPSLRSCALPRLRGLNLMGSAVTPWDPHGRVAVLPEAAARMCPAKAAISSASRTVQSSGGTYQAARDSPTQRQDRSSGRAYTSVRNRTASHFWAGPIVFCDQVLHGRVVQGQLGIHPLELGVLRLRAFTRRSSEASRPSRTCSSTGSTWPR